MSDRRNQKTDQAIFQALQTITEETPLSRITVSAVAREANITRKTFYDHFPTVLDAYQAFLDSVVDEIAEKTEQDWQSAAESDIVYSPVEETELRLRFFLGNVRILIESQALGSRQRNRRITQEEQIALLSRPFLKHVENGLLGDSARFRDEIALVSEFVLAGMLWMYRRWLLSERSDSFYEAQLRVCRLIMGGLREFDNSRE